MYIIQYESTLIHVDIDMVHGLLCIKIVGCFRFTWSLEIHVHTCTSSNSILTANDRGVFVFPFFLRGGGYKRGWMLKKYPSDLP